MSNLDIKNENSKLWITASFFDQNSSAATPTALSYSLNDAIDGTVLATGTKTPATSVEIEIASSLNGIRHNKQYEKRTLNVIASFTGGQQPQEFSWLVKNLGFTQTT